MPNNLGSGKGLVYNAKKPKYLTSIHEEFVQFHLGCHLVVLPSELSSQVQVGLSGTVTELSSQSQTHWTVLTKHTQTRLELCRGYAEVLD